MTRKIEATSKEARPAGSELVDLSAGRAAANGLAARQLPTPAASAADDDAAARRPAGGFGLYLHAFRRRWPLAISLGLFCALAAMAPTYFLTADRYTATALLKISAGEQNLVFQSPNAGSNGTFDIYKGTQQQLLTSDTVLIAALRQPEAASVSILQKEDDPVRYLAKNLHVELPPSSEIMKVSLTGAQPGDVAVLVGAVVNAYMNEVVDADRNRQKDRLNDLDRLYTEKDTEMRSLKTQLKSLTDQLGTGDSGVLSMKQQMAMQQYSDARNELVRLSSELQRAKDDLQIKKDLIKAMQAAPKETPDAEPSVIDDPTLANLTWQIEQLDTEIAGLRDKYAEPLLSSQKAEREEKKKMLVKSLEERKKYLAARPHKTPRAELDILLVELQSKIRILEAQVVEARNDVAKLSKEAERFGNSSIDVQMMMRELQYLDKMLSPIAEERDKLKVDLRSPSRITVFQHPESPRLPDSKSRLQNVAIAGGGSFFGVIFLVLWLDVRKQRINSLVDLSRGLGLTVVGTVPLLPQKMDRARIRGKKRRRWQNSLDHAVDSIAARLFLRKDGGGVRVVMVSSASQGEGKTTLAVQLATRLARAGERTLLVDYDLRRPAIHRIFGLSRGPGVSDCLRKDFDLNQIAHPTDAENLSVITAGDSLEDLLGPLSNGVTTAFFEKAREAFTFVIVDSSPILPVIDGLLVSQHADIVVLSVRRDTSEAPQVLRACDKLSAFGSGNYVVVLNGSHEEVFGGYHEQVITARVSTSDSSVAAGTAE